MSGQTTRTPCLAANFWPPALVMKFCSVQVRPDSQYTTPTGPENIFEINTKDINTLNRYNIKATKLIITKSLYLTVLKIS